MAQHTRARMADRGCCRPSRLRGSGTVARKESRLPERNASRRLLREVLPGENRTSWPTDFLLFAQAQFVNSPGCPSWTSPVPKSAIIPWGVVLDENSTLERLKSFPVVLLPNVAILSDRHVAMLRQRHSAQGDVCRCELHFQ